MKRQGIRNTEQGCFFGYFHSLGKLLVRRMGGKASKKEEEREEEKESPKCILFGGDGVGKSSLALRFCAVSFFLFVFLFVFVVVVVLLFAMTLERWLCSPERSLVIFS